MVLLKSEQSVLKQHWTNASVSAEGMKKKIDFFSFCFSPVSLLHH